MSNAEHVIETLILCMRDGKTINEIMDDPSVRLNLDDENCGMTGEEAVRVACMVVYDLYEGKFPIDHLETGDICIDSFGCNPCIITHVGKSIHALYFSGKTHKFPGTAERYFKKLGVNVCKPLNDLLDTAVVKTKMLEEESA